MKSCRFFFKMLIYNLEKFQYLLKTSRIFKFNYVFLFIVGQSWQRERANCYSLLPLCWSRLRKKNFSLLITHQLFVSSRSRKTLSNYRLSRLFLLLSFLSKSKKKKRFFFLIIKVHDHWPQSKNKFFTK